MDSSFPLAVNLRQRLLQVFNERAFSFGDFTLASGKKSSYYVNSKKALFNSEVASLLGDVLYEEVKAMPIEAAGGLEIGAIPMVTTLAQTCHRHGRALEGFFVRKAIKDHGSREPIEGVLKPGSRVIILDDVLTTGESAMHAAAEVEIAGGIVACVLCIVDRLEGAREAVEDKYPFRSLFTIRDFGVAK